MQIMDRFLAYYQAFELTYMDDDWSRLDEFFDADVVYRVTGGTEFDCEIRGRDAVFSGIRKFLDGFDRRCTRRLESLVPPEVTDTSVLIHGAAYYTRGDSPEIVLILDELLEYRDGLIVGIIDTYPTGATESWAGWMERWGEGLSLSYV